MIFPGWSQWLNSFSTLALLVGQEEGHPAGRKPVPLKVLFRNKRHKKTAEQLIIHLENGR